MNPDDWVLKDFTESQPVEISPLPAAPPATPQAHHGITPAQMLQYEQMMSLALSPPLIDTAGETVTYVTSSTNWTDQFYMDAALVKKPKTLVFKSGDKVRFREGYAASSSQYQARYVVVECVSKFGGTYVSIQNVKSGKVLSVGPQSIMLEGEPEDPERWV